MNDFDYDVMQKKRIARGAFHKKSGSRSKGCRLPYENLTKKEREALNGEVFTINTLEKMSWERFKTLPVGLQTEYLNTLVDRFNIGLAQISVDLFGLARSSLYNYADKAGILTSIRNKKGRHSNAAKASWLRWINSDPIFAPVCEVPEEETEPEKAVTTTEGASLFRAHDYGVLLHEPKTEETEKPAKPYPLNSLNLVLKGNPNDVMAALISALPSLLDGEREYRFTLNVDDYVIGR